MCRPDYFDVEYEINPWMKLTNKVDRKSALMQWQAVHDAYIKNGIAVLLIDQVKDLPDMTFTANGGLVYGKKFILSHHKYIQRQGEEKYFQNWFEKRGYEIHTLTHFQSGEGDALFFRDTLYLGYGFRSEIESHQELSAILGVKTVSLKLINPYFYDFDLAFCPVGDRCLVYYPEAFDLKSQKILEQIPDTVALNSKEANGFVGNSVLVGDTLFVEYTDAHINNKLRKYQVKTRVFPMSEFNKSGGGIKCLTLFLEH